MALQWTTNKRAAVGRQHESETPAKRPRINEVNVDILNRRVQALNIKSANDANNGQTMPKAVEAMKKVEKSGEKSPLPTEATPGSISPVLGFPDIMLIVRQISVHCLMMGMIG